MPENKDKSQEGPATARKKPGRQGNNAVTGDARQARLAEALRANLRRRKAANSKEESAGGAETKEE